MAPEIAALIQKSLDTIEDNLRAPMTAQELSAQAGFSLYHYYRVFEAATGMSVMRYIKRRRLLHAAYEIGAGKGTLDAALEYGFDTHAGFYKAFRREFGCAPSRYVQTHRAARPERVNLQEATKRMDSKRIERALAQWGLEDMPLGNIYYHNTGNCSENTFAIGEKYYLKVSRQLGELHRQVTLQKELASENLAAEIIAAKDGREIVQIEDTDFILLRRIPGDVVNAMHLLEKPQNAYPIGEGIARLHAALRKCASLLCMQENLFETVRDWAMPAAREAMGLNDAFCETYLQHFGDLYPLLPVQIVHRDPNPDNLFLKDGRVTGFVDFDLSRILPRIFDPCYAATGVLADTFAHVDEQMKDRFFEVARYILKGYDAKAALTQAEKEALPDMIIAIELICVAAFSGKEQFAQMATVNQRMLRMIISQKEKLHSLVMP